jgi:hypothetical protein
MSPPLNVPRKYRPIGHCIYCGRKKGLISDEHIIPFGLQPKGVNWFLPKASCSRCADVTKKIEQFCQKSMFGTLRTRLGLKTRRKKQRSRTIVDAHLVAIEGEFDPYNVTGRPEAREIPAGQFPAVCLGFRWPPPGLLRNKQPSVGVVEGEVIAHHEEALAELLKSDSVLGKALRMGSFNILLFQRFLAKIAHSYAIAEHGELSFIPALTDLIRGRSEVASHYIGGLTEEVDMMAWSPAPMRSDALLHLVNRMDVGHNGVRYLGVVIRLFVPFNMPPYFVIVGQTAEQPSPGA